MPPRLTEQEVREVMALRGVQHARVVGKMYGRSVDTIRKIWRGDAYEGVVRGMEAGGELEAAAEESGRGLLEELMGGGGGGDSHGGMVGESHAVAAQSPAEPSGAVAAMEAFLGGKVG